MCRELGWSWADLQSTPGYIRRAFWDLMVIRRSAEAQAARDRAEGGTS